MNIDKEYKDMNAEEMFECLGFKKTCDWEICTITYERDNDKIEFDLEDFRDKYRGFETNVFIDLYLLRAINQQCKELNWYNVKE